MSADLAGRLARAEELGLTFFHLSKRAPLWEASVNAGSAPGVPSPRGYGTAFSPLDALSVALGHAIADAERHALFGDVL